MKQYLAFKFTVDQAEEDSTTGYLKGYAAVFGNVDQGLDVIHKGAFSKTIKDNNGIFPYLLDHDPTKPAGYMKGTKETDKGLYYEAELKLHDPLVKQRYELAKMSLDLGKPMGNSIGYSPVKYDFSRQDGDQNKPMVRNLKEIRLYEGSSVTFPMNELAGVTAAKALQAHLMCQTMLRNATPEQIKGVFESLQANGYDESVVKKALEELGVALPEPPAAKPSPDPELLQSVDKLIKSLRA